MWKKKEISLPKKVKFSVKIVLSLASLQCIFLSHDVIRWKETWRHKENLVWVYFGLTCTSVLKCFWLVEGSINKSDLFLFDWRKYSFAPSFTSHRLKLKVMGRQERKAFTLISCRLVAVFISVFCRRSCCPESEFTLAAPLIFAISSARNSSATNTRCLSYFVGRNWTKRTNFLHRFIDIFT